jgi:hypothetical protein
MGGSGAKQGLPANRRMKRRMDEANAPRVLIPQGEGIP